MRVQLFQVDAFTDAVFSGNPAGVCPLDAWLDEKTMLAIAAENNISETAFCVQEGEVYGLRWFSPKSEVRRHWDSAAAFMDLPAVSGPLIRNWPADGRSKQRFRNSARARLRKYSSAA